MKQHFETPPAAVTIGGTDPCGAYGVVADLKTFAAHHVYGQAVVTVVTAQSSRGWWGSEPISTDMIGRQLQAILEDYGAGAVKTGFLGRVEVIDLIAGLLPRWGIKNLVVDPVLVNGRGQPMFDSYVSDRVRRTLVPLAAVVTPNRAEARLLLGRPVDEAVDWQATGPDLVALAPRAVWVVKGERLDGRWGDWLLTAEETTFLPQTHIATTNTAGSGDTLAAAIAAGLAQGRPVGEAVASAQAFTHQAISRAAGWRLASGPGPGPTANFYEP